MSAPATRWDAELARFGRVADRVSAEEPFAPHLHEEFTDRLMVELGEPLHLDYVRLNLSARRS